MKAELTHLLDATPHLAKTVRALLNEWPEHEAFIQRSLSKHDAKALAKLDDLSGVVQRIAHESLPDLVADYRFTCDAITEETYYFARHGRYRHTRFQEVEREVYANHEFMTRYVNGLLLSQIFWWNHAATFLWYAEVFVGGLAASDRVLEVGPGHGLFLGAAMDVLKDGRAVGVDVSAASLEQTRLAFQRLGLDGKVELQQADILGPSSIDGKFDAIIASEILEHLEKPQKALEHLRSLLSGSGKLFLNVPVNSPAPDHIFLFETSDAIADLIERAGLKIVDSQVFPMTGYTLERAQKTRATISCAFVVEAR